MERQRRQLNLALHGSSGLLVLLLFSAGRWTCGLVGVPDIYWNQARFSWAVHYPHASGRTSKMFSIGRYVRQGISEAAADEAALLEAKSFRDGLVHQGRDRFDLVSLRGRHLEGGKQVPQRDLWGELAKGGGEAWLRPSVWLLD